MKALIRKDLYVIWKQMRIFLLVMLVISCSNGIFGSVFIVVWAAMLPYTAMAYDEQSKWDRMAAMMPYSTRDLVLSKYVLGWLCAGAAGLAALTVQLVVQTAGLLPKWSDHPWSVLLLGLCGSMCVLAVTLPMMFRFGVEKGRFVMILLVFLVCMGSGALSSVVISDGAGKFQVPAPVLALALVAAVALTLVSVPMSMGLYHKKK